MSDGAHQGIGAERALKTILGGEPAPTKDEGADRESMERRILSVTYPPTTYDDAALYTARFILTTLRAHPEIASQPVDSELDLKNSTPVHIIMSRKGWGDLLKEADPVGYAAAVEGITGFMWGWAVNAVRYVLDLPAVSNPAIIEIEEPE